MSDRFIVYAHRTGCYHCKQHADQIITAVPYRAEVVCANCGATRVYVPRIQDLSRPGDYDPLRCYDVWELTTDAPCRNCHGTHPHNLVIGCRNFSVRCQNCSFTHFYKFDLEYMAKDGPKET